MAGFKCQQCKKEALATRVFIPVPRRAVGKGCYCSTECARTCLNTQYQRGRVTFEQYKAQMSLLVMAETGVTPCTETVLQYEQRQDEAKRKRDANLAKSAPPVGILPPPPLAPPRSPQILPPPPAKRAKTPVPAPPPAATPSAPAVVSSAPTQQPPLPTTVREVVRLTKNAARVWIATYTRPGQANVCRELSNNYTLERFIGECKHHATMPMPAKISSNSIELYPTLWCDPTALSACNTRIQLTHAENAV